MKRPRRRDVDLQNNEIIHERTKSKEIKKMEAESLKIKIESMLDDEQLTGFNAIANNALTLITGPFGSGKTLLATAYGALGLKSGELDKVYISRPLFTEPSEQIGMLPGTKDEKLVMYLYPILQNFERFFSKTEVEYYIKNGQIEMMPTMFMRGITIQNRQLLIGDEFQNSNRDIMMKVCSRIGKGGKLVLISDHRQIDLRNKKDSGLYDLLGFKSKYFSIVDLSSNHRHPLVEELVSYYDDLQNKPKEDRVVYRK